MQIPALQAAGVLLPSLPQVVQWTSALLSTHAVALMLTPAAHQVRTDHQLLLLEASKARSHLHSASACVLPVTLAVYSLCLIELLWLAVAG